MQDAVQTNCSEVLALTDVRIVYSKLNNAKYISHLDLLRCMQRAIKRAEIPVWYTMGFNPHIYINFPLPLSLGFESDCEIMEIRIIDDIDLAEIKDRLNAVLSKDMQILSVSNPKCKLEDIASALYEIRIWVKDKNSEELSEIFNEFLNLDKIETEKKSKKGIKTVDIKPDCTVVKTFCRDKTFVIKLITPAGIEKNINPSLFVSAFMKFAGFESFNQKIKRKAIYDKNGQDFL